MRTKSALLFPASALIVATALAVAPAARGQESDPPDIGFNRAIRPILSDRCFPCHGPDSAKRKAELRFDRQASAFAPLPRDPDKRAFVPGKPGESEAYRRITSPDPDVVMPPAKSHLKLDAREKEVIGKWIQQGAKWQEHWAFIKPVRPQAPAVKDASWARNDIDRFILARLEAEGIKPNPEADKPTLIRRVSLDLTGIPPTPAEVDAFMADHSTDAYEQVVDRLLASPRYGEQMAIRWLDYARYADSHGFQSDPERFMWHWRDWVINAYNRNMPFDQFTVEQLAGDMLPNATVDQKIASGFNRNHRINDEGGIIAEEWRVEGVIDRVETTSETWLGLTMGCCRCHDHKFDPITQKEFYQFSSFFNSINETGVGDTQATDKGINVPPILKLPDAAQKKELETLTASRDRGNAAIKELDAHLPGLLRAWEKADAIATGPYGLVSRFPLHDGIQGADPTGNAIPTSLEGVGEIPVAEGPFGKALDLDGKGNDVNAGDAIHFNNKEAFSYGCWANIRGNGALLSKMDDAPGYRGFDVRIEGDFIEAHLVHAWPDDAIKVITTKAVPKNKWVQVMVTYDGSEKAGGVKVYVNGEAQPVRKEKDHLTDSIATTTPLLFGRRVKSDFFTGSVEEVSFFNRALSSEEVKQLAVRPEVEEILKIAEGKRSEDQKKKLEEYFRTCSVDFSRAKADLSATNKSLEELDKRIPDTMVMEELPKPRDTFILIRGQYDKHGEKVQPGLPAVLPPMPAGEPMNRLGLAKWIVDPSNPLTARVQVNRLWEKFFGTGLVKTSENLGTQAETPSNPELLDWLATELIRDHWDLKAFQKLIVTSAAYRQASTLTPELLERDPENRLIARGPRLRLPAETIRDEALAVSGLLVERIGGPSVKPYEPANLWDGNLFGNLGKYVPDKGDGLYRRGLYMFWKRTATPPNMTVFDMPSREYCVIKRSRTNTPLQALDLLNDPTYLEASRVLAEHIMTDGGSTPAERIAYCFHRATCRTPTAREGEILLEGFERQLARYRKDRPAAEKFVSVGDWPRDPKLDVSELAAYTMTASVILNLDEMVNKP